MDVLYLFHRYRDDVYRLAVNYTRSSADAEDVCQTVFLKLMENPDIMPGKERAWLMRVTANTCRDLLRSHWWKRTVPLETLGASPQAEMDETALLLHRLPPKYRVVLYLHYYEQYTTTEIAELLQIPMGTVSTRLRRGREVLKTMLKEG